MPGLGARRSWLGPLLVAAVLLVSLPARGADAPPDQPLAQRHARWLEDVELLIQPEERAAFLALTRDYQRDAFIERFWQLRDPFPETAVNELRDAWEQRVKSARQRWGTLTDARAAALLVLGEPAAARPAGCRGVIRPLELWHYGTSPQLRRPLDLAFVVDPSPVPKPARLWHPSAGLAPLLLGPGAAATPAEIAAEILRECGEGGEVLGDLQTVADWDPAEAAKALPRPSLEWLQAFRARSTDLPPGAALLPATLTVDFPARYQSRTVVEAILAVPPDAPRLADGKASFLVDGEVLLHDELFESFRYRFDLAADPRGGPLPLLVQRYLRPGNYTLVLRVEDLEGQRYFRAERELVVPVVAAAPVAAGPVQAAAGAMAEEHAASSGEHVVKLLAPPAELLETGPVRFDATTQGQGIARLAFALDGKPVFTKASPPYSVELDLGRAPRTHVLRATALDADGKELASDEIMVNGGPHRFAVRLLEPRRGGRYQASLLARAEVVVPAQQRLDRVEFYLNDTRVATLYQPPFAQPMLIPAGQALAYVRVAAFLDDGSSAEDLVFVNQPANAEEVRVDMVELYATAVDRRGRLVEDLQQGDFRVREDGKEQQIRRFELVRDLPIHAGVALDVSASMSDKLDEAVRAALRFFQLVIGPRDQAAVVTFNQKATMVVPFTHRQEVLAGSLAHLTADGETALYDAVIYTLHYFNGIKGRRAVVLITDGQDTKSRYRFEEALEYARRTGVAVYAVGLGLSQRDVDVRALLSRLGEETGGQAFFIERAGELDKVYSQVQAELRSQYLIAYQSTGQGDKFRTIELRSTRPGIETKTIRGYYP